MFDYRMFLQKDGINYTSFYPKINLIEKHSKKDFKFYIFQFKNLFVKKSKSIFSKETSSLVLGVLFGLEDDFDVDLEGNFRKTGLIHILVLSGFNLTIIAFFIFKMLGFLHRNIRYLLSLFFIFIFIVMVGMGATVFRAGIMIAVFIFGKLFYRNSSSINALILAATIMIFLNPPILLYDPSFQLSFTATFGLISFYKYFDKVFNFITNKFGLREIIASNISVQITIIPLLIYLMGEFSAISLIPNILVLPLIPVFMLTSFLSIIFSFFSNEIAIIFVYLTEIISNLIIGIVNYFSSFNFSIIKVGNMDIRFLLLFLFSQILFVSILRLKEKIILKQKYNYLRF